MILYISTYILKIGGFNTIGKTNSQLESLAPIFGDEKPIATGNDIFEVDHRGTAMADFEPTSKPGRFCRLQMGGRPGAQCIVYICVYLPT